MAAGIAGSNPAGSMDVCLLGLYFVLSRVSRGLFDELIPRLKQSYPVSIRFRNPKRASKNVDRLSNPEKIINEIFDIAFSQAVF
jgi:hypothetical protein